MAAIGESSLDDHCELDLAEWLQNKEVASFQRNIEERIVQFLFNCDPEEAQFVQAVQILAWVSCRPEKRASLQREITALNVLNQCDLIPCWFGKGLWETTCKVGRFIADHKTEILVGAAICATGIGIAVATGYTLSVAAGGVVIAGAGSIFAKEEPPNQHIPKVPPPSSKEEIALVERSSFSSLPRLELPSSVTELLVTADGIWINGQFFSTQDLMQHSLFVEELKKMAPFNEGAVSSELLASFLGNAANRHPVPNQDVNQSAPQVGHGTQGSHFGDGIRMDEPQPRMSKPFTIEGEQRHNCYIGWINGINNTLQESKENASYIQTLSGGHAVSGVYNCTHGPLIDILESAFLNHQGYSPNTAQLLQAEWRKFHEANKDLLNAKLLQVCHSQGAIDVKNALIGSPSEIRDRVIVVAIAPAAIVPKRLCFQSYNYASEKDFVYKLEPPPPQPVVSLTIDDVIVPTFGETINDREELIILAPHPEAEGIDHSFQSPTYQGVLEKVIADYHKNGGEYPPEERGS